MWGYRGESKISTVGDGSVADPVGTVTKQPPKMTGQTKVRMQKTLTN